MKTSFAITLLFVCAGCVSSSVWTGKLDGVFGFKEPANVPVQSESTHELIEVNSDKRPQFKLKEHLRYHVPLHEWEDEGDFKLEDEHSYQIEEKPPVEKVPTYTGHPSTLAYSVDPWDGRYTLDACEEECEEPLPSPPLETHV